jgi:chaperonin cofactor prefoldin
VGGIITIVQLQGTVKAHADTIALLEPRVETLEKARSDLSERLARIEQQTTDASGSLKRIESILTKGR